MKTETRRVADNSDVGAPGKVQPNERFWSTAEIEIQSYLALSAAQALMRDRTQSGVTPDDFILYMRSRKVEELVEGYIRTCRELAQQTEYLHRRVARLGARAESDVPAAPPPSTSGED